MSSISTNSLSIGYGTLDNPLQTDINLDFRSGELIGMLGQNGVGKTTLIKTLLGIQPLISGSITYQGKAISEISQEKRSKMISVVLTDKPASMGMTVYELLSLGRHQFTGFFGRMGVEDDKVLHEISEKFRLTSILESPLFELSDGQLQKVMIGRALVQETPFVILDEPTAHLDIKSTLEILDLLKTLAGEGKGILISSHDARSLLNYADKFWLFSFTETCKVSLPEESILTGDLQKVLGLKQHFDFNLNAYSHKPHLGSVSVIGDETFKFWVGHALSRYGFGVATTSDMVITKPDKWMLETVGGSQEFDSLRGILETLERIGRESN